VGAVFALIGLGALDIMFLLPVLMGVIGILIGGFFAAIGVFIGGGAVVATAAFSGGSGGPLGQILFGLGLMAVAATLGAIVGIVSIGVTNAVVWFARLHYRLLKPAMGEQGGAS
jgi:uncharacterized membrane protein